MISWLKVALHFVISDGSALPFNRLKRTIQSRLQIAELKDNSSLYPWSPSREGWPEKMFHWTLPAKSKSPQDKVPLWSQALGLYWALPSRELSCTGKSEWPCRRAAHQGGTEKEGWWVPESSQSLEQAPCQISKWGGKMCPTVNKGKSLSTEFALTRFQVWLSCPITCLS